MELLKTLLKTIAEKNGSDLHIRVDVPPVMRKTKKLIHLDSEVFDAATTKKIIEEILSPAQIQTLKNEGDIDLSLTVGEYRFRGNVFFQRSYYAGSFRYIPNDVPDYEEIGLGDIVPKISRFPNGLVLCTGPAGSGKTTTLACIVDLINRTRNCHIVTLEDPIEFIHTHKKSVITQREILKDTSNFQKALKHILRQDPDVIMVGELRNLETVAAAITLAETGHLVLATLHTIDSAQTLERIINIFPGDKQDQIRMQLSLALRCVITQFLIPNAKGDGLVLAKEIMLLNSALKSLIREGKTHQIYTTMKTTKSDGNIDLDSDLKRLFDKGLIELIDAAKVTQNPESLMK